MQGADKSRDSKKGEQEDIREKGRDPGKKNILEAKTENNNV